MRPVLYHFPISHYCEKVRWALDLKGVQYRSVSLIPGMHVKKIRKLAGKSSVPVLQYQQDTIQGSAAILDYLDIHFPQYSLTPKDAALKAQALEWERRLDAVAVDIRVWCYHYLLSDPDLAIPLLTAEQPLWKRWLIRMIYPKVEQTMRRWMKINEQTAAEAQQRMEAILLELRACYAQSHVLVGETFSRADLTACAVFAMAFQPQGFPVPWPGCEQLPPAMKDWLVQHEDELQPLRVHYEQYR